MAEKSYYHAIRTAAFQRKIILPPFISTITTGNEVPTNLVFKNANDDLKNKFLKAMTDIKFTRLDVKIINGKKESRKYN